MGLLSWLADPLNYSLSWLLPQGEHQPAPFGPANPTRFSSFDERAAAFLKSEGYVVRCHCEVGVNAGKGMAGGEVRCNQNGCSRVWPCVLNPTCIFCQVISVLDEEKVLQARSLLWDFWEQLDSGMKRDDDFTWGLMDKYIHTNTGIINSFGIGQVGCRVSIEIGLRWK